MRILILSWRCIKNPKAGGSEIFFHEMAKIWTKKGHKITMIVGGWEGCKKEEIIDGINVLRTGAELTVYAFVPFAYWGLKEKPDIIIDVSNGIGFFSPLFAPFTKKFFHIHHIHRDIWSIEAKGIIGKVGKFLEMVVTPVIYRKTPIITLSESSKSEISEEKLGKVIGVVNPGIEFYKYKKYKKEKNPTILFLNRIKKYKGIKVLLDAVNKLKEKPQVWIVGDGDDSKEMWDYTEELGLKDVTFFGKVSEERKQELMQKAWVFVNPSKIEGWSIVNIEANYFGLPVIGSNVSGIKDSVIDGKTGLLFEYGNYRELAEKIKYLIKNKKTREKMSKEANKWARKFSWDKAAEKYLNIITGKNGNS